MSGTWRVSVVPAVADELTGPDYDDSAWRQVEVPGAWSEQGVDRTTADPRVAVYRRTFLVPDDWNGRPIGLAAWLVPEHSRVWLNGEQIEPEGEPPYLYAEISIRLGFGRQNSLVVATQFDGSHDLFVVDQPRIGPIGEMTVPLVSIEEVGKGELGGADQATIYRRTGEVALRPAVVLLGTGSHGLGFTEPFVPLASELAVGGSVAVVVLLDSYDTDSLAAVLASVRDQDGIDPDRVALIATSDAANAAVGLISRPHPPAAVVALSATGPLDAQSSEIPVLLIAPTSGDRGPTAELAAKIAESLGARAKAQVLPGAGGGLQLIDSHWNEVRRVVLDWLAQSLGARAHPR